MFDNSNDAIIHGKQQKEDIQLVDENTEALKLSTSLPHVKYNLILIVNVEKQPDQCFSINIYKF